MSARKRNQWLDGDENEDSFQSASEGSDAEIRTKTSLKSRTTKRRRLDDDLSSGGEEGYSDDEVLDKSQRESTKTTGSSKVAQSAPVDDRFAAFAASANTFFCSSVKLVGTVTTAAVTCLPK